MYTSMEHAFFGIYFWHDTIHIRYKQISIQQKTTGPYMDITKVQLS